LHARLRVRRSTQLSLRPLIEGMNDQSSGRVCREDAKLYPDVIPGRIEDASPESMEPPGRWEEWIPGSLVSLAPRNDERKIWRPE